MKKFILTFISIVLLTVTYAQEAVDFEKEKEAIFNTFKTEKVGFETRNMELMKENIVCDESYVYIFVSKGSTTIRKGFSDQEKAIKSYWDNLGDAKRKATEDFEIKDLKIYPNSAWAVIEKIWESEENENTYNGIDLETLFMEKKEGNWKISSHHIVSTDLTIYSMGLVGSSLPGSWYQSTEMKLSEESSDVWEGLFDLTDGEVKFRANNEWFMNWGGDEFPEGNLVTDGPNIKVPKGKYQVRINLETEEYSFKKVN